LNERAMALLEEVGLTSYAKHLAVELPYGRKRALEIATTLALEPEMLLLDEPTSGMGREDIARTAELIKRVSTNRTVLMVEHNLSVVPTCRTPSPCWPGARSSPRVPMRTYRRIRW